MRVLALLLLVGTAQAEEFDVKAHYQKHEYQIAMRDGVKLFTIVYTPRDTSQRYPFLFKRTPYSVAPYGADRYHAAKDMAPADAFLRDGYILVLQDVRGRYKSEGQWENYRLQRQGKQGIDESTDIYDTIEWLLRKVPGHNGRVGQWGISHDGWMTVMGVIQPHPALKAASPQATTADAFFGDDFHHNGAFIQEILDWVHYMGASSKARGEHAETKTPDPAYGTPWNYEFFLNAGPIDGINAKYFGGVLEKQWDETIQHPDYDEYWQQRNALDPLVNIKVPVLNVLGWFDTFDPYGSMATYKAIEQKNQRNKNTVVAGPWRHGGWRAEDGSSLGPVKFGSATSEYYQNEVVFPFFQRYLKDRGDWAEPEAVMFETGNNAWHRFEQWPPKAAVAQNLYLQQGGGLSLTKPAQTDAAACDEYVSDPAKPVPYTSEISNTVSNTWRIEDQRPMSIRPDVLAYRSEPLAQDVTIAGPIGVELFASTTGTDSDWVVKLIDIHPNDAQELPGYQLPVGMEIMRGRYRNSFSKPEPMKPGEVTPIRFDILDKFHTFKKGHRIGVQVQSSFFPYIDRNPQQFVNIYRAKPEDYVKATQRVCRSASFASHLVLPVLKR
ncbi:CocE/NonD family hydrolase [Steroidobacter sp.]|uniref:CocE/NonD family hydrolase n=1 Tax=Steroidobacter sp. TaxID=1978227 RepID=UPI001A380F44|nr:CocE/NonD family hydrolase [Steroidobacter sp.]MBL8271919.1 CocE/NonD family hydrolase [Steroidobacter sp.]